MTLAVFIVNREDGFKYDTFVAHYISPQCSIIFLDSSIIIAYKNKDDISHQKAADIFLRIGSSEYGQAVISEFVFGEVATVLFLKKGPEAAVEVGNILRDAREVMMMRASAFFDSAWEIFKNQKNGIKLSFVDASSLACLRERSIRYIATFDKDFEKIKNISVISG